MSTDPNTNTSLQGKDANLGRSQAIFIVVGLVIVLGGLWMLYNGGGPYHP